MNSELYIEALDKRRNPHKCLRIIKHAGSLSFVYNIVWSIKKYLGEMEKKKPI